MQVLFGRQPPPLERWCALDPDPRAAGGPLPGCYRDVFERQVGREPVGPPGRLHQGMAAELLRFNVFPPHRITPVLAGSPIRLGTTVGVQYHLIRPLVSLFFAARVVRMVDGPEADGWRTGFTYQTLPHHPELGEELFCVTKREDGSIWVSLTSWSVPGTMLTRLGRPITRWAQARTNEAALHHLHGVAFRLE